MGGGPAGLYSAILLKQALPRTRIEVHERNRPDDTFGWGVVFSDATMAGFAARALKRPVKWTGERGESFLSDTMGRDHVTVAELAFDANHVIQGLRANLVANMGAYYYQFAPWMGYTVIAAAGVILFAIAIVDFHRE